MINTDIFEEELESLYDNYYECINKIVIQNKILLEYVCEDGLLPEAESSVVAIGNAEKELAQIKKDYEYFIRNMGEYKSLDELGEALFEVEKKLMDERYGTNDSKVVAEMSLVSDNLKKQLVVAYNILSKY
jgi:hypothetical protein